MALISSLYADFICGLKYEDLPSEVIVQAKRRILDTIGVSLAGYKLMRFPQLVADYFVRLGGLPEATVIPLKKKIPAVNAAMVNAVCAHSLDMDDGHRFGAVHPGTVIVPATIAAAEVAKADTKTLICGIVAGYEVMIRVAVAINPSSLSRGFHVTGTCGALGAAACTAKVIGMNHEETVGALGLAGLQASGLLETNHSNEGSIVKPITPGRAAMSGLLSSLLAREGMPGPSSIFEGEDGFLKAMADEVNFRALTNGLGKQYEILNTYDKLYAACRHAHSAIDATLKLVKGERLDPTKIRKITVETYSAAIRLAGITGPNTPSAARFSIPFSVALVVLKKDAGAANYSEETINDENIRNLVDKVQLVLSEKWNDLYPQQRGATVIITDNENRAYSCEVGLAKGEPENPASEMDIYNKFFTNASLLISERDTKLLADNIMNLEKLTMDRFIGCIAGKR